MDDLEEEALLEGVGVGLEVFAVTLAVIKNVTRAQRIELLRRQIRLCFQIVVVILRHREKLHAVLFQAGDRSEDVIGGERDMLHA